MRTFHRVIGAYALAMLGLGLAGLAVALTEGTGEALQYFAASIAAASMLFIVAREGV